MKILSNIFHILAIDAVPISNYDHLDLSTVEDTQKCPEMSAVNVGLGNVQWKGTDVHCLALPCLALPYLALHMYEHGCYRRSNCGKMRQHTQQSYTENQTFVFINMS